MNLLTSYTILNDVTGKPRISYTYDVINESGEIQKSNVKGSYIILDEETLSITKQLEEKIGVKLAD